MTLRAYSTGYITSLKSTHLLVSSAVARFGAVCVGCVVYPVVAPSFSGAALGVAALLSGFTAEALMAARAAWRLWSSFTAAALPPR